LRYVVLATKVFTNQCKLMGAAAPGGGIAALIWSSHSKMADIDCIPPGGHFFKLSARVFAWNEDGRVELLHSDALRDEYATERNKFVGSGN